MSKPVSKDSTSELPETTNRQKRSWRNLLLQIDVQLKYTFYLVGGALVLIGSTLTVFFFSLKQMLETVFMVHRIDTDIMAAINSSLQSAIWATITLAALLTVASFSFGIILSHRIVGPMVPIRRLIRDLIAGDYGKMGSLREKDDFQDLMAELNELSKTLAEKHGKK